MKQIKLTELFDLYVEFLKSKQNIMSVLGRYGTGKRELLKQAALSLDMEWQKIELSMADSQKSAQDYFATKIMEHGKPISFLYIPFGMVKIYPGLQDFFRELSKGTVLFSDGSRQELTSKILCIDDNDYPKMTDFLEEINTYIHPWNVASMMEYIESNKPLFKQLHQIEPSTVEEYLDIYSYALEKGLKPEGVLEGIQFSTGNFVNMAKARQEKGAWDPYHFPQAVIPVVFEYLQ